MSQRIRLKNPASKASLDHVDKDYDPAMPEVNNEEPRDVKRKIGSIRLVNPNANKKRKTESEGETSAAIAKAREIEEALRDVKSLELELALIDKQITHKSPAVKLKTPYRSSTPSLSSSAKKTKRSTKKYDDDELDEDDELIEDDDDDAFYRKEPSRIIDHGNKFEESSLTDEEDYDFDIHGGVATNRAKRPLKPSQKYPEHAKKSGRNEKRRERAEQRERERALQASMNLVDEIKIMGSSPAVTPAPTPSRRGKSSKKAILDVPFWKPIKAKPNTSSPAALAQCLKVLQEIKNRPEAFYFKEPVDPVALGIVDYFKIIKQPMDLDTVQKNLKAKKIMSVEQFCQKMRLIWTNAIDYNGSHHDVGKSALVLAAYFEDRMKPVLAQENPQAVDASELKHKINIATREYKSLQNDLANLNAVKEPNTEDINPTDPNIDLSPQIGKISEADSKKTIEYAEKCHLYNAISGLQPCFYRGLYQLVIDANDKHCLKIFPDHVDVDADTASPLLLMKLQLYIKECQAVLNKDKKAPVVEKTPGKQLPEKKEKSVESEKSSSTSETDSDSDDSSVGDPRLKTGAFVGIFEEKKQQLQQQQQPPQINNNNNNINDNNNNNNNINNINSNGHIQPQIQTQPQQHIQPQIQPQIQQQYSITTDASKLILPTSPLVEERKPVVLLNSESWSQLNSFETPKDKNANQTPTNDWESLKNRKTQLEQLEKEKEEQEILKNQQSKIKAEEEAKRVNDEMLEMRRQAEISENNRRQNEETARAQNIATMRENERKKRENDMQKVSNKPVNMMDQFEIMKNFQANFGK
jgi:hypothetical protein